MRTSGAVGLSGDLLMLGAVLSWATYAVLSRSLLDRHSPLFVTGWTMIAGTVLFVAVVWRDVVARAWADVPCGRWRDGGVRA